jgi:hypothetical protein
VTLVTDGETVKELKVKYFDTLPPCISLCVLKTGFLFAASEFGNHGLYQFIVSGRGMGMAQGKHSAVCWTRRACWGLNENICVAASAAWGGGTAGLSGTTACLQLLRTQWYAPHSMHHAHFSPPSIYHTCHPDLAHGWRLPAGHW